MLSIVMSVYNGEKTVGKAIESMLEQTYKNFEFIIVDDCSIDETLKILYAYQKKDNRIKILKNEKNLGIAASLNKGILEAKGEWIVRMDDDDISLPDRLEKQINFIQKHPDIDIFGGKAILQDTDANKVKNYFAGYPPIEKKKLKKMLYTISPIIHVTVFMKKESIINIGMYNAYFSGAEDYELWVRAWENGLKIENIDEFLIKVTINPGKRSFGRIWKKFYVKNYIIKQYHFPLYYYIHNFFMFIKDILININLYNPRWSIRKLIFS